MKWNIFFSLCLWTSCCFGSELWEKMSLEEKVGQVLMVQFHGERANDDAKTLIQETKVGGIIYYNWSNGLHSPEQVFTLSTGLQKLTQENRISIPLLIAADQEGGVVARLQSGFTSFPGNRAIGETEDLELAERTAFAMGQEMRAVGINMNLAPVVDVNSNPRNPVIGLRSFGDSAEGVTAFGRQFLAGFKQAQVIATLKHFPGHGDVTVDSHASLPVISKSKEALEAVELLPFATLASSADAIMTAHILVPALDVDYCATLSEKILGYLRETIGFEGVIIADSLVMEGVLKQCQSVDVASIRALNAGCDLLILGGKRLVGAHAGRELTTADVQRIHGAIVAAVKSGRLSEARLDAAVRRILRLKERYLSHQVDVGQVDAPEHRVLAQKIASLVLEKAESRSHAICLSDKRVLVVAPGALKSSLQKTSLFKLGRSTDAYFFNSLNPSNDEIEAVTQRAKASDILMVCSYNAWKNPSAVAMTESLLDMKKPVVLLCLRDPLDAALFPRADLVFTSFSPTVPSIQAICDQLVDKCSFTVSPENANAIGERIWKNECAGSIDGLTNWKEGENFASLGIGHFIWYSCDGKEGFRETFPALLTFLQQKGASLPVWLQQAKACPWSSREEFYGEIQSPKMNSLRQFLFDTRDLQALFMANRLHQSFTDILAKCAGEEKIEISSKFRRLAEDAAGLYALIDYLNFKGEGTSATETYKGQGWGLLQVLQKMPGVSEYPLTDFVQAAKTVLDQRVKNSPPERNESHWLKGWFNRLDTYLTCND